MGQADMSGWGCRRDHRRVPASRRAPEARGHARTGHVSVGQPGPVRPRGTACLHPAPRGLRGAGVRRERAPRSRLPSSHQRGQRGACVYIRAGSCGAAHAAKTPASPPVPFHPQKLFLSFESDSSKQYRELDFVSCEVEEGKAGSTASPRASPAWPAPRLPVMA